MSSNYVSYVLMQFVTLNAVCGEDRCIVECPGVVTEGQSLRMMHPVLLLQNGRHPTTARLQQDDGVTPPTTYQQLVVVQGDDSKRLVEQVELAERSQQLEMVAQHAGFKVRDEHSVTRYRHVRWKLEQLPAG